MLEKEEKFKKLNEEIEFKNKIKFDEINAKLNKIQQENIRIIEEDIKLKEELKKAMFKIQSLKDLNIDIIKNEMININKFDSYSVQIKSLQDKNTELTFKLDKKEAEIMNLYSYIRYRGIIDDIENWQKQTTIINKKNN